MNTIIIRGISLPGKVKGCTIPIPDDDFLVLVNTDLCQRTVLTTIKHEVRHIRLNHFQSDEPVIINEIEAG